MASEVLKFDRPPSYPIGGTYADLLFWHLYVWGTRPGGSTTQRGRSIWEEGEFLQAVFARDRSSPDAIPKNYRNWIGDSKNCLSPGRYYAPIIEENLFGGEPQFQIWLNDLEQARKESSGKGQNRRTIKLEAAIVELARAGVIDQSLTPPLNDIGNDDAQGQITTIPHRKVRIDMEKVLQSLRHSQVFAQAIEDGISLEDNPPSFEELIEEYDQEQNLEEMLLLKLLGNRFSYQQHFAWECLLGFEELSHHAIDALLNYALKFSSKYHGETIGKLLDCTAKGFDRLALAKSLLNNENPDIRKISIEFLIQKMDDPRHYAKASLSDPSEFVRLEAVKYLERRLNDNPELVTKFCILLDDPNNEVRRIAARGLLGAATNEEWEIVPKHIYPALAVALSNDMPMWTTLISTLSKDDAPIDDFRSVISKIMLETDFHTRKRIISCIPGERSRYVEQQINNIASDNILTAVQAAYHLGDPANRTDEAVLALQSSAANATSLHVRSAAALAVQIKNGTFLPRDNPTENSSMEGNLSYPLWTKIIEIKDRHGLDIRELTKIINFCKKFDADVYVRNFTKNSVYCRLKEDYILDLYSLCFDVRDEAVVGASGPEAIDAINALALFIENGVCT